MSLTLSNKVYSQVAASAIARAQTQGNELEKAATCSQGIQDLVDISSAMEQNTKLADSFKGLSDRLSGSSPASHYGALSAVANAKTISEFELQNSAKLLKNLDVTKMGLNAELTKTAQLGGLQAISKMAASINSQALASLCGSGASPAAVFVALDNLTSAPATVHYQQDQVGEDFYNK